MRQVEQYTKELDCSGTEQKGGCFSASSGSANMYATNASNNGVSAAAGAAVTATSSMFRMCCNANIRRHLSKRVFVGRSTIHGWGAFIAERAEKNDFIMEYVGE